MAGWADGIAPERTGDLIEVLGHSTHTDAHGADLTLAVVIGNAEDGEQPDDDHDHRIYVDALMERRGGPSKARNNRLTLAAT